MGKMLYKYRCDKCHSEYEIIKTPPYTDDAKPVCDCGNELNWYQISVVDWSNNISENKNTTSVSTDSITPYFDVALGREISSKSEIRKICKEKGWVYGDSKDLDADAERNKRYNEEKFRNGMMNEILRNI